MANCNTQQLNITCGTDVVLHDRLIFEGETFDPNLSVGIAANLVSSLGKRTALDVQVVDDELLISVPWIDGTLPGCYGLEVTGSCNSKKWATYADSLIKYTKATRPGASEVTVESDSYDITQEVGYCYSNTPVTFAEVTVDDGYGTPSVDVEYEQRVLSMAFHNLKGNGITGIDVDEQVGDEAVNTVTIKTDADQEGTEFKVRNGRRGNGIASSSEVLSDQDGGTNTFTITDDDGTVHEFHSKNGTKGSQGDSAVYDPSDPDAPDFEMANTTGQSTTKAMTQKAITEELDKTRAYQFEQIDATNYQVKNFYIRHDNGLWRYLSGSACVLVPVIPGDIYKIIGTDIYAAYLSDNTYSDEGTPSFSGDTTNEFTWLTGESKKIPEDVNFLYILTRMSNSDIEYELHRLVPIKDKLTETISNMQEGLAGTFMNELIEESPYFINNRYIRHDQQEWLVSSGQGCVLIPVKAEEIYTLIGANLYAAYLSDNAYTGTPSFAGGTSSEFTWQENEKRKIPQGVNYLYLLTKNANTAIEHELIYRRSIKDKLTETISNMQEGFANALRPKDNILSDFSIEDENGHAIVAFKYGHIITKNFNSKDVTKKSKYEGMRLSILGDSMSTFGVPDKSNATGTWTWPGNRCRYPQNDLFSNVEYQYWYLLMERLGLTLGINESWAGSRISNTQEEDSGDLGPNRHIASMTRIGHLGENGNPDIIIVEAGGNDVGAHVALGTFDTSNPINYTEEQIAQLPVDTFADAYRTMLIRLQFYYQSSRIICIFPWFTTSYWTMAQVDDYIEVMREACDFFGIEYVDLRQCGITIYNRGDYLPDDIHPNAAGMELIYNHIVRHALN